MEQQVKNPYEGEDELQRGYLYSAEEIEEICGRAEAWQKGYEARSQEIDKAIKKLQTLRENFRNTFGLSSWAEGKLRGIELALKLLGEKVEV
mgnify:FL=1